MGLDLPDRHALGIERDDLAVETMNLSLYQLADDYRSALVALEDSDHDPDVIRDTLDSMLVPVEEKAANVAAYTLNIEAEAEAIAQAEAKLKTRRQSLEKRAAWMRDYLKANMEACGIQEIAAQDKTFRVRLRQNPEAVELDGSLPALPLEFMREKVTREPDKTSILAALKAGQDVPGARLVRRARLEIK
jgi:hypothetical protein